LCCVKPKSGRGKLISKKRNAETKAKAILPREEEMVYAVIGCEVPAPVGMVADSHTRKLPRRRIEE